MFSSIQKQIVFIDFGFSLLVAEEAGYKTLSTYHGTFNFISKEMAKLFGRQKEENGFVDLYYNDLVGLQKTFKY